VEDGRGCVKNSRAGGITFYNEKIKEEQQGRDIWSYGAARCKDLER